MTFKPYRLVYPIWHLLSSCDHENLPNISKALQSSDLCNCLKSSSRCRETYKSGLRRKLTNNIFASPGLKPETW